MMISTRRNLDGLASPFFDDSNGGPPTRHASIPVDAEAGLINTDDSSFWSVIAMPDRRAVIFITMHAAARFSSCGLARCLC